MIPLIVATYFLIASAVLLAWLVPGWRVALAASVRCALSRLDLAGRAARTGMPAVGQRSWLASITLAALALPPLFAFMVQPHASWFAFETDTHDQNRQVDSLLRGERLVPPPPLPPEIFTTHEVSVERPSLADANRDWSLIDPQLRSRLLSAFDRMWTDYGYRMVLLEGYRSADRQRLLVKAGPAVTGADAFQSLHQYGLAADCAFFVDGHLVISERDRWAMRGYELFGHVTESLGLSWGGRWKLRDYGHVELRRPASRAESR